MRVMSLLYLEKMKLINKLNKAIEKPVTEYCESVRSIFSN